MKLRLTALAALLASAAPAIAQDIASSSNSGAEANSGSVSGASSDNYNQNSQGQAQTANNAGIGNSESTSGSAAVSDSASISGSASYGNQQGQSQGQQASLANTNSNTLGQGNQQGVTVNQTWNSTNHKRSYVGTNTAVPLAASSSFSSDYCGGTVSGGASIAPIGVSIGGAGTKFDESCRYLRLGEKAGMLGANYHNMGQHEMALKAMSMMAWAVCMAGPKHTKTDQNYAMQACITLGLLGSETSPATPPAHPPVTPPEAYRATPPANDDYMTPKTPRGEATVPHVHAPSPALTARLP